jgi:hypothetical protein
LSFTNDFFTLEERGLKFQFFGECSVQQKQNLEGIRKITFDIGLRTNGVILGTLKLALAQNRLPENTRNYFNNIFNLDGQDMKTELSITMEKCFVRKWGELSDCEISCEFLPLDVILGKDNVAKIPPSATMFHFGLTNVFKIRRTNLPHGKMILKRNDRTAAEFNLNDFDKFVTLTQLGKLEFYNYANMDENEKMMLNFKLPLITAGISVEFSKSNQRIDSARKQVRKLVEDFLILSSLIQTCKHDWKFILIVTNDKPVFIHLRVVKHSLPNYFPLDNGMSSFSLYQQSEKLSSNKYKKNITLALDWYLESVANQEFESKFLQMATALECLLDAYHEQHQSEYILSKSEFSSLRKKIVPEIFEALKELGLSEIEHEEKFKTVESHFENLRRRTLANKFRLMVDQLQIDYSNVPLKPSEIVMIRNKITHRGGIEYVKDERELQEMNDQYKALWSVIIRIFFRLLNYSGNYYDPYLKSLISFTNKVQVV